MLKYRVCNIIKWAAFTWYGVGSIAKINTRMNEQIYKNFLENNLEPFADENMSLKLTFMHDTSRLLKKWLDDRFINVLKRSSLRSPYVMVLILLRIFGMTLK